MRRTVVVVSLVVLAFVATDGYVLMSSSQTRIPAPPSPPVVLTQTSEPVVPNPPGYVPLPLPDPRAHVLTRAEESVVSALLSTILEYVDRETRYGCGDKGHPRYFPQHPKLALMYHGGTFIPKDWLGFREATRSIAPAVTLVPYSEVTPETYIIDITGIQTTQPIATATYRHSAFSFGSGFASQPIFGGPGREGPPSVAQVVKTSRATFSLVVDKTDRNEDWASARTLTLGNGNFVREDEENRAIKDKPELLEAIAEGIKKFELALEEPARMTPVDYNNLSKGVTAFDHSQLNDNVNVVVAVLHMMLPEEVLVFAGWYRTYLLEKEKDGWRVVDMDTTSFTDYFSFQSCREP